MEKSRKPMLLYPVAVEGKYDKAKLSSLFEGQIIATDGFGIFQNSEKGAFFRRLAEKSPVIVFTDSDSAGLLIRRYFKNLLPKERQIHLYIPPVKGKEKRKSAPSKEGLLGVEGSDSDAIRRIFAPYVRNEGEEPPQKVPEGKLLTRIEFYERGYGGGEHSREKRRALCRRCGLPEGLSASSLIEALNLLYTREELERLL